MTGARSTERYKVARKTAKRALIEAKGRAYDDLYRRLSTNEGEKDVYKIDRIRERKTRDLTQVKCNKDEMDQFYTIRHLQLWQFLPMRKIPAISVREHRCV